MGPLDIAPSGRQKSGVYSEALERRGYLEDGKGRKKDGSKDERRRRRRGWNGVVDLCTNVCSRPDYELGSELWRYGHEHRFFHSSVLDASEVNII